MFEYAGKQMEKNAELKAYILDFVHKADYNITDVYTEREKCLFQTLSKPL